MGRLSAPVCCRGTRCKMPLSARYTVSVFGAITRNPDPLGRPSPLALPRWGCGQPRDKISRLSALLVVRVKMLDKYKTPNRWTQECGARNSKIASQSSGGRPPTPTIGKLFARGLTGFFALWQQSAVWECASSQSSSQRSAVSPRKADISAGDRRYLIPQGNAQPVHHRPHRHKLPMHYRTPAERGKAAEPGYSRPRSKRRACVSIHPSLRKED